MNRAVRVRRTVVKNERRPAARDLAQLPVDVLLFPELLYLGLAARGMSRETSAARSIEELQL
jgi:hypothetical protein